jgi:hypothetical protein
MYGKHSVLQVADVVLLVSSSGFYHSAEVKAKKFGYRTISPAISPIELGKALGIAGDFRMGAKIGTWSFHSTTLETPTRGQLVDDGYFRRVDGSELIKLSEYQMRALTQHILDTEGPAKIMAAEASVSAYDLDLADPTHEGEPLYVNVVTEDQTTVLTPVIRLSFNAKGESTNWGHFVQTEQGNFDGAQFATGASTIGGSPARMVVAEANGAWKAMARWQYEVKGPDAGPV